MGAARDLRTELEYGLDPVLFARSVGVDVDAQQARFLCSSSRRLLLNCTRQFGKSTTAGLKAAHRAIHIPNSLILCVSPGDRQSALLFDKIADFVKRCPYAPKRTEDNKRSLRIANGSHVVSLPGSPDTIRGYSAPDIVLVDEAAFCEDALFGAVGPMLAVSGGQMALLSTPYGKRGAFYEAWEKGGTDWDRVRVTAEDCPRISRDFLAREKRSLPDWLYRQEYMCEFVETLDSVFTHDQVESALIDGEEL